VTVPEPPADVLRLEELRKQMGVSPRETWVAYFSLGGDCEEGVVSGWFAGNGAPSDRDYNLLAQAVNDLAVERGGDHPATYRE